MKKFLSVFIALVTTLSLAACDSPTESESGSSSGSGSSSSASESSGENSSDNSGGSSVPVGEEFSFTEENLPRMDGSTSATPLEVGLKAGFLNIPYSDAEELVSHTTTHDSFKRLLSGEVDMIFSVPISAEQQKAADDAGVKLIMKPVAREGFVFVVNGENPVDGLTSEQLRKIYSGDITNWKEVGGNDEPIIPYQRNTDSGSQNYMTVFMGDTPLLKPQNEYIAFGMGGLMDAVAVYDNSAGAIGYSVYSYAAQMYENADKVKFIAIDGVKPSKATMADESYPLLSNTYIIYTDKSPESVEKFTEAVLSDKGQKIVLDSGYLPVNGMDVPEKYLPYEAVGTGVERPADFKPSDKFSKIWLEYNSRNSNSLVVNKGRYYELAGFLKDTELTETINKDIRGAMDRLRELTPPMSGSGISVVGSCCNGYMSITVGYPDDEHTWMGEVAYYKAETINYDLFSGKKIEKFSDLFYKGEDFLRDVTVQFNESVQRLGTVGKKMDYAGILGEPKLFTIEGMYLEPDNLYFDYAPLLSYSDTFKFHSPVTEYRDMKPLVFDEYVDRIYENPYDNEWETKFLDEDGVMYRRYVGSAFHTDAEVKAKDNLWYGMQKRAWDRLKEYGFDQELGYIVTLGEYENYYSAGHFAVESGMPHVCFDKETLDIITMEDVISGDWQQYVQNEFEAYDHNPAKIVGVFPTEWYSFEDVMSVWAYEADTDGKVYQMNLSVPLDKFNERYIDKAPEN